MQPGGKRERDRGEKKDAYLPSPIVVREYRCSSYLAAGCTRIYKRRESSLSLLLGIGGITVIAWTHDFHISPASQWCSPECLIYVDPARPRDRWIFSPAIKRKLRRLRNRYWVRRSIRARELIYPMGGREKRREDRDRFDRGEYLTLRVRAIDRDNNLDRSRRKLYNLITKVHCTLFPSTDFLKMIICDKFDTYIT